MSQSLSSGNEFVDPEEALQLCKTVAKAIRLSGWLPNIVIGLADYGFFPAVWIARMLGGATVVGLDTKKFRDGRSLGDTVFLASERMYDNNGVLVVDVATTDNLLETARCLIGRQQAQVRTAALIAIHGSSRPDYVARSSLHVPRFFWEVNV